MALIASNGERSYRVPTVDYNFAQHAVTRMQMGVPLAPPLQEAPWLGGARWRRRFSTGLALLNYESTYWNVRADGTYYSWRGDRYTAARLVVVPPFSGAVLSTKVPL